MVRVVVEPDLRQPVTEAPLARVEVAVRIPGAGSVRPFAVTRRGRVRDSTGRGLDDQRRVRPLRTQAVPSSSQKAS